MNFRGANCTQQDADPADWFPPNAVGRVPRARADAARLCNACPCVRECAQRALALGRCCGIWAGIHIPEQAGLPRRDALKKLRRIAR